MLSNLSAAFFYRKVEKMHTKSSQISVGFEPMQSRARMRQFFVSECNEALKKRDLVGKGYKFVVSGWIDLIFAG